MTSEKIVQEVLKSPIARALMIGEPDSTRGGLEQLIELTLQKQRADFEKMIDSLARIQTAYVS